MKRIKLFTALLLAAAMVLPMAGCGKGKPKDGGEASPASCAAAGEYEVYSMTTAGTTLTRSQLEAGGMAEGMFLKINADGTGEINYTGSQTNAIKVDEKAGKVKIEGGAELDYALEGGRITLTLYMRARPRRRAKARAISPPSAKRARCRQPPPTASPIWSL